MTDKMKEYQKLIKKESEARVAYFNATYERKEYQQRKEIPKVKAKYEGKYFVYENRYSSEESWPLYLYVQEVISTNDFRVIEFQKTTMDIIEIKMTTHGSATVMDSKEISRSEFANRVDKIVGECTTLFHESLKKPSPPTE